MSANVADTWMPLYVADWEADTLHLTCEEDGAYGRLIRWYWRNGPPVDDDRALCRIVRVPLAVWRRMRPVISPYFVIEGGRWRHARADRELKKASAMYRASVENGKKGGRPRKNPAETQGLNLGLKNPRFSKPSENTTHNSHSTFGESPSQGEVNHDARAVGSGQVVPLRRVGEP